jgi:hypothetical protein
MKTLKEYLCCSPLAKTSWPDPRLHTFRLRGVFSQSDFKPSHSFPLTVDYFAITHSHSDSHTHSLLTSLSVDRS